MQWKCTFSSKVKAAKPFASSFPVIFVMYLLSLHVCSHVVCIVASCLGKMQLLRIVSYCAAKKEVSKPSPGSVFMFCPNVASDLIESKLASFFFCKGCFVFKMLRCSLHSNCTCFIIFWRTTLWNYDTTRILTQRYFALINHSALKQIPLISLSLYKVTFDIAYQHEPSVIICFSKSSEALFLTDIQGPALQSLVLLAILHSLRRL